MRFIIYLTKKGDRIGRPLFYMVAITSTSTSAPLGSVFTATQERAGLLTKYLAYIPLNAAKSAISERKQVVLITFSKDAPAAQRTAFRFLQTCSVCSSIVVASTFPVLGSIGIWPDVKTIFPIFIACE